MTNTVGDRATFQVPLAQDCLSPLLDVGRGIGMDHVAIILAQLVMHVLWGMARKVTVLVNGAALDRQGLAPERDQRGLQSGRAIDDDKFRLLQTACTPIAEEHAPCSFAFSTHILDGKQHLLAIPAHPDRRQNRDVRGLSVQPGLDDRAVQNKPAE